MFTHRTRTIARTVLGTAMMASAIGLSTLGVVGTANAAPVHPPTWTCYDYATQINLC